MDQMTRMKVLAGTMTLAEAKQTVDTPLLLERELNEYASVLDVMFEKMAIPDERFFHSTQDLVNLLDDVIKRFTAARRGLGLANKLPNPEDRKKHMGKVLSNMNRLRGLMKRVETKLDSVNLKEAATQSLKEAAKKDNKGKTGNKGEGVFNDFDTAAQSVWTAKTLVDKQKIATSMVNQFISSKAKKAADTKKIAAMTKPGDVDMYAASIMQIGHGNKVIR